MSRKIRVALIGGAGYVAQVCLRYLVDKSDVVLGIGNRHHLGEDLGTIAGIDPIGVVLSPGTDLDELLEETKPDVAIDCTYNEMENVYKNVKACLEHGVSVISVGVFCYYPQYSSPEITRELDAIARENNCTFLGSSSGDLWQNIPAVFSAGCGKISRITLGFHALLDDFGQLVAKGMGIGAPPEKWDKLDTAEEASPWEPVVRLLAEQLGLTAAEYEYKQVPIPAKEDIHHEKLDMVIRKGCYMGRDEYVTLKTEEGIDIVSVCHTKIADPGEKGSFEVDIEGEPELSMKIDDFRGEMLTSTIMVNRVPDMIDAPKGVITVNDMPEPLYRPASAFLIEE